MRTRSTLWSSALLGAAALAGVVVPNVGCAAPVGSGSDETAGQAGQNLTRDDADASCDGASSNTSGHTSSNVWGGTAGNSSSASGNGSDDASGGAAPLVRFGGPTGDLVCRDAPVVLNDVAHDPTQFEDFFRMSFLTSLPPTPINMLGSPSRLRVFMTASFFFKPALPLAKAVEYVGATDVPSQYLAAFRCRPPDDALDALLATWPNFFEIFQQDFAAGSTCPPPMGATADNVLYCIASSFVNKSLPDATIVLDNMFDTALPIFEDPALTKEVSDKFGIFRAFSGLGYAVKGSADPLNPLENLPLTAEEIDRNLLAPEYTVVNATLSAGGCRCILVPPYSGRSEDPIDPDFVWKKGGTEACRMVQRLRPRGPISMKE